MPANAEKVLRAPVPAVGTGGAFQAPTCRCQQWGSEESGKDRVSIVFSDREGHKSYAMVPRPHVLSSRAMRMQLDRLGEDVDTVSQVTVGRPLTAFGAGFSAFLVSAAGTPLPRTCNDCDPAASPSSHHSLSLLRTKNLSGRAIVRLPQTEIVRNFQKSLYLGHGGTIDSRELERACHNIAKQDRIVQKAATELSNTLMMRVGVRVVRHLAAKRGDEVAEKRRAAEVRHVERMAHRAARAERDAAANARTPLSAGAVRPSGHAFTPHNKHSHSTSGSNVLQKLLEIAESDSVSLAHAGLPSPTSTPATDTSACDVRKASVASASSDGSNVSMLYEGADAYGSVMDMDVDNPQADSGASTAASAPNTTWRGYDRPAYPYQSHGVSVPVSGAQSYPEGKRRPPQAWLADVINRALGLGA